MGLFGKKKNAELSGFRAWLKEQDEDHAWIAGYVNNDGSINEEKAFYDAGFAPNRMYAYTIPQLKELVVALYADYLRVEKWDVADEDVKLLGLLELLPINVSIRRVKSKQSGNNWSAQYLRGTTYYGKTLLEAVEALVKKNSKVSAKVEANTPPSPTTEEEV